MQTKHIRIAAYVGLVVFMTGLVLTGLQGYFDYLSAGMCLAGLAAASTIFLPMLGRNLKLYANMALYSIFFVASAVVLFLLVQRHPASLDATRQKLYSISPVTRSLLTRLDKPVKLTTFLTESDKEAAALLLREYARHGRMFSYEIIHPFRDIARARAYGAVMPGDTFLTLETSTSLSMEQVIKIDKIREEELTNGIVQLLRGRQLTIYFLAGHGELSLDEDRAAAVLAGRRSNTRNISELGKQLARAHIKALPLNLAQRGRVPLDASLLVCAAPRTDISGAEQTALRNYLETGGKAVFLLNPEVPQMGSAEPRLPLRNLTELIEDQGIMLPQELAVAPGQARTAADAFLIMALPKQHRITRDMSSETPLLFSYARPVLPATQAPRNTLLEPFLITPPETLRVPMDEIARALITRQKLSLKWEEKDLASQPLAVAATRQLPGQAEDRAARVVVIGNGNFLSSEVLDQNGWMLFLNAVNWITNSGDLIAIPSSRIENTPIILSDGQKQFLFLLLVIIVPMLIALAGIGYSYQRRARS